MLIEKIDISKIESESGFDYEKTFKECFIDLDQKIMPPQTIMGIGTHFYKDKEYINPTFTLNEKSIIVAPKKTKKTFFKTALSASYIGGNASYYFDNIISKREDDLYVFDFDTEQGAFYAQWAMRRVAEMVGHRYPYYMPFSLKKLSKKNRLEFIDRVLNDPRFKGRIGMVFIDGIVDLCENPNDYDKASYVSEKTSQWNDNCHICEVIHKTTQLDKARGHLGTIEQEKVETSIFLSCTDRTVKNSAIEVRQEDSRGAPFDTFYFHLDTNLILPKKCEYNITSGGIF